MMQYDDLLKCPCFVINMDRCKHRLDVSLQRIHDAGFHNVERFRAVDAMHDSLQDAWQSHGNPQFDNTDQEFVTFPGKQGCMLSHLNLWKYIIDKNIPLAVVFEDDVCFHSQWDKLAPKYFENSPKDFDILYMGSQMDVMSSGHITRVPVFCTHAYIITRTAAEKLYNLLVKDPNGVRTIDCMLIDHMKRMMMGLCKELFVWYVWNGTMFLDVKASISKDWAKRNTGLVFQDYDLGTYVRPW